MINMDMFFDFMAMILKNHMFNMHLSKIFKNKIIFFLSSKMSKPYKIRKLDKIFLCSWLMF